MFQWWFHVPFAASDGAVGSRFPHEIGIRTKLKPHFDTFVKDEVVMVHPLPHGSEPGLPAGFPVPKSRPSTLIPTSGTTFPLLSYTLVLPGTVCSHPEIIGAQGGELQSGFVAVLLVAEVVVLPLEVVDTDVDELDKVVVRAVEVEVLD